MNLSPLAVLLLCGSASAYLIGNDEVMCWALPLNGEGQFPCPQGMSLQFLERPPTTMVVGRAYTLSSELSFTEGAMQELYDRELLWVTQKGMKPNGVKMPANMTGPNPAKTAQSRLQQCTQSTHAIGDEASGMNKCGEDKNLDNCCLWHTNIHACGEVPGRFCGPWVNPQKDSFVTFTQEQAGNLGQYRHQVALFDEGLYSLVNCHVMGGFHFAIAHRATALPASKIVTCPDNQLANDTTFECESCPSGHVIDFRSSGSRLRRLQESSLEHKRHLEQMAGDTAFEKFCKPCPAGTHAGSDNTCTPCVPGFFSNAGAKQCTACAPGEHAPSAGHAKCQKCPAGSFQRSTGASACEASPIGSFTGVEGESAYTACPETRTTLVGSRASLGDCVCKADHYGPGASNPTDTCEACPWLQTSTIGAQSASDCTLSAGAVALIAAAVLIVLGSVGAFFLTKYLKKRYQAKVDGMLEKKLRAGLDVVKNLAFPMVVCSASTMISLSWDELKSLHEGCRNTGHLIFLDTVDMINAFKQSNKKIVFWSYQWLSWQSSGPNGIQWDCMRSSLEALMEAEGLKWSDIYIWLDILSIPQFCDATKGLAVNSLYTFAQLADYLIVIAPSSEHDTLKFACGPDSYKKRVWCRAEQFAFFCFHGMSKMFLCVTPGAISPVDKDWMNDVSCIFNGDMTCCARKHENNAPCDRQSLVLPLLALYFDLYTKKVSNNLDADAGAAWNFIAAQLDSVFPATFSYITQDKSGRDKVIPQTLFGDMISRASRFVEKDIPAAVKMSTTTTAGSLSHTAAHDNKWQQLTSLSFKSPKEIADDKGSESVVLDVQL